MRTAILALLLPAFVLAACGKDTDSGSTKGSTPSTALPDRAARLPSNLEGGFPTQWTGMVEKMGPSIEMQGTHRLVDADKTVVILKSAKVDLSKYEGKRVSVSGPSTPTVEGTHWIVDVEEIKEVP